MVGGQAGSTGWTGEHDANGNRVRVGSWTDRFDPQDRLVDASNGSAIVGFQYGPEGKRTLKFNGSQASYSIGQWLRLDGEFQTYTKYYYAGRRLVASRRAWRDANFLVAEGQRWVMVAGLDKGRLVVGLTELGLRVGGWGLVGFTALVLLAPVRRRAAVVGLRPSAGAASALCLLVVVGTLPIPILLRPPWARGGGGGSPPPGSDTLGLLHYHLDPAGSIKMLTREDGSVYRLVRYDAYGRVRGTYREGSLVQTAPGCSADAYCREFAGHETEPVSGLAYAPARFYQPALGMFLGHDPARQFASPYTYGGWDPVNTADPSGALAWGLVLFSLALAAAVASAIDAGVRTGDFGAAFQAFTSGVVVTGVSMGIGRIGMGVVQLSGPLADPVGGMLAVAGTMQGVYGMVSSFQEGNYATGIIAARQFAASAY